MSETSSLRIHDDSDEALMSRVQDDDVQAFGQLYDRHVARALRVAGAVCSQASRAEDAVQEGFLSIWRSRARYRPELGSFQAWSMRIMRRRAIDSVRRDRPAPTTVEEVPEVASGSLQDEVIARSEGDVLRASLQRLPDAQAEVITLAFFGQLTHTEIADELSLPEGTVKGRMRLGLDKLRIHMEARS